MSILLRLLVLAVVFGGAPIAFAQFNTGYTPPTPTLQPTPVFPEPGQTVTVSLNDYSIASDNASVSWILNGEAQPTFANKRQFTYTAGAIGSADVVIAQLSFPDGRVLPVRGVVSPAYIDIILEADSYVPPFYRGRPVPSYSSTVRATGLITNGSAVSSELYSYRWSIDNNVIGGGAQLGARSVVFEIPIRTEHTLKLDIIDSNGVVVGRKSLRLPIVNPELQFYERSTLYGLSRLALAEQISFPGNSITIEAVPYYLDTEVLLGNTVFEWSLNNSTIKTGNTDPFLITLNRGGDQGTARLEFQVQSKEDFLQGAKDKLRITF